MIQYSALYKTPYIQFSSNLHVDEFNKTNWLLNQNLKNLIDEFIKQSNYPSNCWGEYYVTFFSLICNNNQFEEPQPHFITLLPQRLVEYNSINDERAIFIIYVEYTIPYNTFKKSMIRMYLLGSISSRSERFQLDKPKDGFTLFGKRFDENVYLIPKNKLSYTPPLLHFNEEMYGFEFEEEEQEEIGERKSLPFFYNFDLLGENETKCLKEVGLNEILLKYFNNEALNSSMHIISLYFCFIIIYYESDHYDEILINEQNRIKERFLFIDKNEFIEEHNLIHVKSKILDKLNECYSFNDYLCDLLDRRFLETIKNLTHEFLIQLQGNETISLIIKHYVNKQKLFI